MTFNASELEAAIEALGEVEDEDGDTPEEYYGGVWGYITDVWDDSLPHDLVVNEDTRLAERIKVLVKEVSTGTYDDDTYIIFETSDIHNDVRWFRKYGWTASHDGTYWEGSFDEVTPESKTITVWRTVR